MIYFIGAGPGAVDLITVRGMELLKRADLVIYAGSLVNPELLTYCGEGCEKMNSASMTLEEVIAAMAARPRTQTVVRLHTGDPSIYGAIREQMDELDRLGYNYEVVPGVSSMNAAAAVLKAEYTLPGVSQTLIVSRMAGRTPVPEKEDIRSLAAHGASMALFLSAGMLEKLCGELIEGGYAPDTPAAVVYKATWPDEEVVKGTLETLPQKAAHLGRTALVLVGGFMGSEYERSKLYDPAFSHMFREAKK
ncbi:MAG: precorrin-4 C(11)-methyltransferase [Clostridia bacterium]|nr:precorrin-4 C(11)-methyltransferase [Clostridia bacterium]MBQ4452570.1 precorrin-4 C(11)-methyltransferase [Clostridia bacterium]MBR5380826.1 precorrin-4 C(11)-methyltransferase [Clostridia bacterium]MBR5752442.1 precorrin-4 C(11)-methyltransferase [Clostridia bacterium]